MSGSADITNPTKKNRQDSLENDIFLASLRRKIAQVQLQFKRLDESCRDTAIKIDRLRYFYALYGALDGLNVAYSSIKYFFDIQILIDDSFRSSSDVMHEWMLEPEGIAIAALSSVSLVVVAMLANYLKEDRYKYCFMSPPNGTLDKNKLYLEIILANGSKAIQYTVLDASGKTYNGTICPKDLGLSEQHFTPSQLQNYFPQILAFTASQGHTKQPNQLKKYITVVWPYCRDTFKGLKNTFKGLRSLMGAMELLGVSNANFLLLPLSLALGALAVGNRLWYRQMKDKRKAMQEENEQLYQEIAARNIKSINRDDAKYYEDRINGIQKKSERMKAFGSACYGGLIDGLYLYMGLFSLAPLSGPFFLSVCVLSAVYVLTSLITRVYEEYDYQKRLECTAAKARLALSIKLFRLELNELNTQVIQIYGKQKPSGDNQVTVLTKDLVQEFCDKVTKAREDFLAKRKQLRSLQTLSNVPAFLSGLRNGLTAYGMVASILFALGTIFLLSGIAFPPALLFAGVALGMVCLVGFIIHSMTVNYRHRNSCAEKKDNLSEDIKQMDKVLSELINFEQELHATVLYDETGVDFLEKQGLIVDSSPQYFFQEWFEIVRSFFSGVAKGSKATDFGLNPLQEMGDDNHYHSTAMIMFIITGVSAVVYSIALALRAFARGLSAKKNKDEAESAPKSPQQGIFRFFKPNPDNGFNCSGSTPCSGCNPL